MLNQLQVVFQFLIFNWNAAIDHGNKLILVLWKVRLFSTQFSNTSIRYKCLWFSFFFLFFMVGGGVGG